MSILVILAIFIYLFIGMVFAGAMTQPGDEFAMWAIFLWPGIIAGLIFIGFVWVPTKIGEMIRKIFV